MTTIVVMLIWIGTPQGGAAAIPGFRTLAACERAVPVVMAPVWKGRFVTTGSAGATCVELRAE